ncbi:hypothetical protein GKC30_02350 [Pseudodesulfovibrio sp. F-1]|uniref:Uncharacterized protein n=1 Tax=Pseudodesulfovibrio alkaliphilus TaxID=2661613 RepID=A0A7K1KKK7_9BACT|nr:hypothetical protein [Pseudodesulfovibrio alkaliphilus]
MNIPPQCFDDCFFGRDNASSALINQLSPPRQEKADSCTKIFDRAHEKGITDKAE